MAHHIRQGLQFVALLFPLLFVSTYHHTATAGEAVIGHPGIPLNQLSREQTADLFLRKFHTLPDGTKVIVFDHKDDEPIKESFYRKVLNLSLDQLHTYWSKMEYVNDMFPPITYKGDEAIKRLVANTPGGIGYIDESMMDGSVKVLYKP